MPENGNSSPDSSSQSSASPTPPSAWPTTSRRKRKKSGPRRSPPRSTREKSASARNSATTSRAKHRDRRAELLRRLEVDEDEIAQHPKIASLLRENGVSLERLAEILRRDSSPESRAFVDVWDSLTAPSRSLAGIEAIALSAQITPRRLYELFAGAAMMQSRESVALTIALNLPAVMRTTVKEAKTAKGHCAREHLYKASQVLPTPQGSVNKFYLPGAKPETEDDEGDETEGDGKVLESADDFMMRAARAMGVKQLPVKTIESVEEAND